jgi:hypothetical protein
MPVIKFFYSHFCKVWRESKTKMHVFNPSSFPPASFLTL